jgi:hypothetical protein
MNLLFPGDVKVCVSEVPVASCDNGVEFATSEKGKYENDTGYSCLLKEVMIKA